MDELIGFEWVGVFLRGWARLSAAVLVGVVRVTLRMCVAARIITPSRAAQTVCRVRVRFGVGLPDARVVWLSGAPTETDPTMPFRGVAAVGRVLYSGDDVSVAIVSVEVWRDRIGVRLAAVHDDATRRLDEEYRRGLQLYEDEMNDPARRAEAIAPIDPSEALLQLALTLTDDRNTLYRPLTRSAGGTDNEWRSDWYFGPGPPVDAARLELSLGPQTIGIALGSTS